MCRAVSAAKGNSEILFSLAVERALDPCRDRDNDRIPALRPALWQPGRGLIMGRSCVLVCGPF
ncbi:hypothetical protein C4J93_4443 [Pseudomonas sp. R2-37-08W]|nr:hypothetical protein C4J93_4443 [Pseudomonas sp. R2-37-08W]